MKSSPPGFHAAIFVFFAVFFHVTHDELSERGTTHSLTFPNSEKRVENTTHGGVFLMTDIFNGCNFFTQMILEVRYQTRDGFIRISRHREHLGEFKMATRCGVFFAKFEVHV